MSDRARRLIGMSPSSPGPARPCAAESANEAIRAFMRERAGRPLGADERAEYERLLEVWAAAQRERLVEAA
ncbi:hypothetical protein GCM10009574_098690 [Streptomyces asiaticus]|uniref:Uncharacterized protein n=3 Tax=Streptomyces TaxID=1883 RepID=A0ABN1SFR2_9ACTN